VGVLQVRIASEIHRDLLKADGVPSVFAAILDVVVFVVVVLLFVVVVLHL
jgi:hypothetical protein